MVVYETFNILQLILTLGGTFMINRYFHLKR